MMKLTIVFFAAVFGCADLAAGGWRADFSDGVPKNACWWSVNRKANACSLSPWVNPYDGRAMLKAHYDGVGGWMHAYFQTPGGTFPKMPRFRVQAEVRPQENADGTVRRCNLFITDATGERHYFDREVRWTGIERRTVSWIVDPTNLCARTPQGKHSYTMAWPVRDIGLNFNFFEGAGACDIVIESFTAEELPPVDPARFGDFTISDLIDLPNRKRLADFYGEAARAVNPSTGRMAIRCRPSGKRNAFGVDFSLGGSPMGVLSPKLPKFESGTISLDVTTDGRAPLDSIVLAFVDAGSSIKTLGVPCAELAKAGRHTVRVDIDKDTLSRIGPQLGRPRRPFVLRGVHFRCAAGAHDTTVYLGDVSLSYRALASEVPRLELDTGADFNHSVPPWRREVVAKLVNPACEVLDLDVSFALFDWRDTPCGWRLSRKIRLAGGETFSFPVPVPGEEGVFYVRGTILGKGSDACDPTPIERSFVSVRPTGESPLLADRDDFRFGTVIHLNPYFGCDSEMERCARAAAYVGLKVIRTNLFPFGEYDCRQYDKMVEMFRSRGIDLDFILPNSFSPETGEPHWDRLAELYVKSFRRWRGKVAYWELLNEPDIPWGCEHPMQAGDYAELARRTLKLLRENDPGASYMSAGFCAFDNKKLGHFQEEAMKTGKDVFDLHCFHGHGRFEHYRRTIETKLIPLRRNVGVTIPWYANETAINASCGQGERLQAETLYKKVLYSWAKGAKGLTWYNLRGKGEHPDEGEHGFGMLTFDMYPRAVYGAWNGLTRLYGGRRYAGELYLGANALGYAFEKNGTGVACLWSEPGSRRIVRFHTTSPRMTRIDLFGNRREVPLVEGRFELPVEEEPVNLEYVGELTAEINPTAR